MKHLKYIKEYYRKNDFIKQQIGKQETRDKRINLQEDADARKLRISQNRPTILDLERQHNLVYSDDNKRFKTPSKDFAKNKSVEILRVLNKLSKETNGKFDYGVKIVQREDSDYEIVIFDKNADTDMKTSLDNITSVSPNVLPEPYIRPSKTVIPVSMTNISNKLVYTVVHKHLDQEIIYFFNRRVSYDDYKLALVGSMDYTEFVYIYGDIRPNKLTNEYLKTKFEEALIPINLEAVWGSNNKLFSLDYHYHL